MGYKTISVSEDAYEILKKAKRENESFSQVVIRLASRGFLDEFVGCISKERSITWSESMEKMLG